MPNIDGAAPRPIENTGGPVSTQATSGPEKQSFMQKVKDFIGKLFGTAKKEITANSQQNKPSAQFDNDKICEKGTAVLSHGKNEYAITHSSDPPDFEHFTLKRGTNDGLLGDQQVLLRGDIGGLDCGGKHYDSWEALVQDMCPKSRQV